ncbi:MAG: L-histidine N(alpha)-methyltransferase [Candidatus Marsarchaeota archaeon]|nr:L-histidine N(alpha)-methyltransferase [Candidatus Marsarchaeota archaeon]MCL5111303.1 L-histidine N(alpha)-methyltransferase [Candidatus Marsarchaeota archaeon]
MAGIYSPEQEREIAYFLEKLHKSPMKYNYFGMGAKRWFHYAETAKSQTASKGIHILERILITQKVATIFDSLSAYGYRNFNIIDIGVGDGSPAYPVFRYLQYSKPRAKLRYNAIDISPDMLKSASRNIKETFKVYGEHYLFDIESGDFSHIARKLRQPSYGNLFMFLGSTFGNMLDMHQTLVNIRKSMAQDDYFLLGVELFNQKEEGKMLRDYYMAREAYDLVFTVLEHFGARRTDGEYRVSFNERASQVEAYFTPDKAIKLEIAGGDIALKKKEKIMLVWSVKFTPKMLVTLLSDAGYRIEMLATSYENNYALILVQPRV